MPDNLCDKIVNLRDSTVDYKAEILEKIDGLNKRLLETDNERTQKMIECEIETLEKQHENEEMLVETQHLQKVTCTEVRQYVKLLTNLLTVYKSVDTKTKKLLLGYLFPDGLSMTPKGGDLYQFQIYKCSEGVEKPGYDAQEWKTFLMVDQQNFGVDKISDVKDYNTSIDFQQDE